MYVPLFREQVRVRDREGLFTVLDADYVRQSAELIRHATNERLTKVSFAELFATFEDTVEADESQR
jgi:hypothetical protein